MIDWKSLFAVFIDRVIPIVVSVIFTKWLAANAAAQQVYADLMAGKVVSIFAGTFTFSMDQLKLWGVTGAITLATVIIGWFRRVKLKRETAIALALPKGATKTDVQKVSDQTPVLSAQPSAAGMAAVTGNLRRAGVQ